MNQTHSLDNLAIFFETVTSFVLPRNTIIVAILIFSQFKPFQNYCVQILNQLRQWCLGLTLPNKRGGRGVGEMGKYLDVISFFMVC